MDLKSCKVPVTYYKVLYWHVLYSYDSCRVVAKYFSSLVPTTKNNVFSNTCEPNFNINETMDKYDK